jgi:hypothetical protein
VVDVIDISKISEPEEARAALQELDAASKAIREKFKFSNPDECIWSGDYFDDELIVEADGYGGATLSRIEGNHPVDYFVHDSMTFDTEDEACRAANALLDQEVENFEELEGWLKENPPEEVAAG